MPYNQRTWSDFIDQVDAANWNDFESRINSAVSSAVSAISNSQTMLSGTVKLSGVGAVQVGSQTGNAFTISAPTQSVQPVGSLVPVGNTTGTTASLPFASNIALSGGNKITLSQSTGANSSVVAISAADQTVQTQNLHNVTLSGNTAGVLAAVSSGTLTLAGGNNITVSQAGNAVTISGANAGGAQTGISSVAASNTTYTSGQVEFTGSQAVTVRSSANQRVVIDAPAQTVQTQSNIQSIAASNTTYQTGQVEFTGSNMVTVKSSANQRVVIDATQSVQPVGSVGATGNTTGTTASIPLSGNLGLEGGNKITLSQSSGASSTRLVISAADQTAQTQSNIQGVAGSNTTYNTGTVELTGSNMVTVKSSANQRLVIDATQSVQTQSNIQSIAASNTTYSTGQVEFTGSNIVTVKSSANQRVVIDASQSVQPVGSLDLAGNTTGTMFTIPFASNIELAGGNNITLSQSSGASSSRITISAASQSVQTQNVHNVTLSGNTAGVLAAISSGTMTLAGGNNITVSQAGNAVTISGPSAGGVQTGISSIAASNTTYTSGQVEFTGSNAVTVKSSANQRVVIDAPTQTVQPGVQHLVASDATFSSGTVSVTGLGIVTVNTAASKIQISASQSVQPVGSAVPVGNTTGTTASLPFSGNVGIAGGANITVSQSTGAASTNLTIVGGAGGGGVQHLVASDNTFSSGTVSISGSNNITVGTAASKILISAPNTTVQTYPNDPAFSNMPDGDLVGLPAMTAISKTPIYFPIDVPGNMTLNSVGLRISNVTTNTAVSLSAHFGLYTLVNSTSMALLGSGSDAFVVSTASSVSYSNGRDFVLTSPSTVAGISNITPGHYIAGLMFSGTAAGVLSATLLGATNASQFAAIGRVMPGTNQLSTATSQGVNPLYGQGSTTVNALPPNVVASEVKNQGTVAASMPVTPYLFIRS